MDLDQAVAVGLGRVDILTLRHTDRDSAQDVVAEVFLVAWRRIDDVPEDPLPWLLVVARNTLSNGRRSAIRREQLERRLADVAGADRNAYTVSAAEDLAVERATMLAALAALSDAEREAVLLIAWDGLAPADAADVVGCSRNAFDARLYRARSRLANAAAAGPSVTAKPLLRLTREIGA